MATGTSSRSSPAFHSDDLEETSNYRSLSALAIISLVIGLASPLCFGAPLLMVIPIAGIIISILALRQISASGGTLAGGWAAATGLVLCVAFAVAPIARSYVLQRMRTQQAEEFGREWINEMLAGKTEHAFRLTTDSQRPPAPPDPHDHAPKHDPYTMFLDLPIVKAIIAAGPDTDVRLDEVVGYDPQSFYRVYVSHRYVLTPKAKGDAKPIPIDLTLQRAKLPSEGRARWMVYSVTDPNKPASTPQ